MKYGGCEEKKDSEWLWYACRGRFLWEKCFFPLLGVDYMRIYEYYAGKRVVREILFKR